MESLDCVHPPTRRAPDNSLLTVFDNGPTQLSYTSTMSTADLASAIAVLYGGAGEQQQQANQWLNNYSQQPQAWEACLELLDPGRDAEVCFFCANMLLNKVRKEWHKVPRDQQLQMASLIRCAAHLQRVCAAASLLQHVPE